MTLLSRLFTFNNPQKILAKKNFSNMIVMVRKTLTSQPKNSNTNVFNLCGLSQIRNKSMFQIFKKPDAIKLKIKDNLPDEFSLIYRNTMDRYLLLGQLISTICATIVGITIVLNNDLNEYHIKFESWKEQPKNIKNEMYVYLFALITICVSLQAMVMKMPIRIYNLPNHDRYTFIFYGNLPFTSKHIVCRSKDIQKLPETGILPWRDSRYEIQNKRGIIMLENFFSRPADLNIMLGYVKDDGDE